MIQKKLLGEIMAEMGFLSREQLEEALERQRRVLMDKMLPERLERVRLVSEARLTKDITPMLGQMLMDLGFVTREQINEALGHQDEGTELYTSLQSDKLGKAIEIGFIINSTLNLAEVLALIMRHVNSMTNSVASTLMLLDSNTQELVFSVPTGPRADKLMDIRLPWGTGIAGWVAKHEKPALVPDVKKDERFYAEIDKLSGLETKSILCIPLVAKSKLIGVLEVINKEDDTAFNEDDVLLLSIFAYQAAIAIEHARLYEELKERLEEEKLIQRKLAESEKFQALGQMASGVAHDFNNILTAIMGYAEVAKYDLPGDAPAKQSMDQIMQASHRAKDLVNQILAFSRQSEQERVPVEGQHLVREVLNLLRASLPTTIEIRQNIKTPSGTILADPTQIHQIIMNLCTNAHHAMWEKGGILEVKVSPVELDSDDVEDYEELEAGSFLNITVRDTGHGMDKGVMEKIFDPYFTTKEKGVGTGMGLAVVHGIVKSHGGGIKVSSQVGKGTTVIILLPRIQRKIEYEPESFESLPKGDEKLLFVDDEKVIVELAKKMLERLGYKVDTNISPVKALEAFRADPQGYDLVVSDMTMPKMTGDVLAEQVMAIRPDIPVILYTGYSERITKEKAKGIGIKRLVMKPIVMSELSKAIRELLDKGDD